MTHIIPNLQVRVLAWLSDCTYNAAADAMDGLARLAGGEHSPNVSPDRRKLNDIADLDASRERRGIARPLRKRVF